MALPDSVHGAPLTDPWRVTALRSTGLLGAGPSAVLDRIARTATRLLDVPVALVSLVDAERVWFAGLTGLAGGAAEARQAPLSHSFCPHVVTSGAPLVVPDAAAHPLAHESPEVDALGIAAYLGVPLTSADGAPLGALCAIDTVPHAWTAADLQALLDLATGASAELRLREREARSWLAIEATDEVFYTHDYVTGRVTREGAVEAIYGVTAGALAATDGAWLARVYPEDRARVTASWQAALARGTGTWRCEYRMRHPDGRVVVVQDRARVLGAADGTAQRVAGTLTDVTGQRAAEEALRASEARYRALLHRFPGGAVFLVDHDLRFLVADGEALRDAGLDSAAVVGRTLHDVLSPESAAALAPHYHAALAGEERRFTTERAGRVYDGVAVPIRESDGRVAAGMVLTWDVTEQVAQAAALRAALDEARGNEARFRAAFDAMPGSMVVIDPVTAGVLEFNNLAHEQLGYTREEFGALTIPDLDADPDRAGVHALVRRSAEEAARLQLRRRHRTKTGEVRDVLVTARAFTDRDRMLSLCMWLDITDQLRGEAERSQLGEELRRLLAAMREGVYGLDAQGRITFANAAAARLLGTTPEALVGRDAHLLLHHTRADGSAYPAEECQILRAVAAGTGARAEDEVFWRADGSPLPVEYTAEPVRDEAGRVVGSVVLFTDVSARRAADAQRAALEARLRQAQKMEALGQLAGGIAHDFNNLLTVIGGNVDLLHGDLPPELPEGHPARRDLEEITHAAERARGLVRQLLTFSRQQPVKPERLRVGDAVRRIERLLRRVIGEEITLAVDTADAGTVVLADAGQLEQIVMNLAANARDAMLTPLHGTAGTGGTLHIGVDAVTLDGVAARDWDGASAGRWVRLRVRDTGHGMDAATQAHVFEPFFTTKEVGRGTGLGLATVFGVVRQMGGAVRVESAPGRGSTFTVILPVADGDVDGVPPPTRAGVPSAAAGTVLLVEDEAAVRVTARRILERLGYTVLEARDGADALTRWRRHRGGIDAVVTDVRMPEMSGPAFVARVREDAPGTGVVFMSGYVDEDTSLAQGPHETFIEKPFTAEALAAALEHVRRGAGRR